MAECLKDNLDLKKGGLTVYHNRQREPLVLGGITITSIGGQETLQRIPDPVCGKSRYRQREFHTHRREFHIRRRVKQNHQRANQNR